MNINRDKHNKYVAGWTPNITPSTGVSSGSTTSTIIYVGGGSSSGGDSGTVTQQNTFMYYVMSDGTNSITLTATIPTDTAILTLIGKNGVTVTANLEKSIPETEFVSTGTNTGTYKISYNKLVTTPDPTEEVPEPQPITTYPITITYVSGDKILTSSFDTLTLYNTVDETELIVATYNQTQLEIDGDTTGINSIVADANNTVFSRITLSITVEELTTIILDFAVTVNQLNILYVEGTLTELYWKLDDDGNLYTTYNAYSTLELSAYGMGESGGTPTGAEYLYQLKDVSDAVLTPIDKGILQYNAATSQWEVTDGSNITPDLTGYAKEDWVTQQITNLINILKGNAPENMDTLGEIAGVISSLSDKVTSLEVLLEWFEWDDTNDAIKALFDLYGVGEISAYGYGSGETEPSASYLRELKDVDLTNLKDDGILLYNSSTQLWEVTDGSNLRPDLTGYATLSWVGTLISTAITNLIGGAPEEFDTLGEIAAVILKYEQILDWFSFVDGKIRANYDLWGVGEISAYGYNTQEQPSGAQYLNDLLDVTINDPTNNLILIYNGSQWVNSALPESGLNESELALYLTEHNYVLSSALLQYATITLLNLEITNLIGGAPAELDTLGEIATVIQSLQLLLDWFSFVDGKIRANYDLWGVGEISAYGVGEGSSSGGKNYLHELEDVLLGDDLASGQLLQYNGTYWVNIDKDEVGLNETELANYLTLNNYLQQGDVTWSNLSGKPSTFNTTINLINDLNSGWDSLLLKPPTDYVTRWPAFSEVTNKPTTLAGYGITDAYTKTETDDRYVNITGDTMTGNLTLPALIANDYIRIGSTARLEYDSTNNAIKVTNASGGVVNFYATGEVSAYGMGSESTIVGYLDDLNDVTISSPTNGQALIFNGSQWVNQTIQQGLDEDALYNYLVENNYIQESDLSGYAKSVYVNGSLYNANSSGRITIPDYITRYSVDSDGTQVISTGLRLKDSSNYGLYLYFGDSNYVYLAELTDDDLTIHASDLNLDVDRLLVNGEELLLNIELTTSGSGNIVTNVTASGNALTVTKGFTIETGSTGKLAYYTGSYTIDCYASTIGSGTRLWYLNAGVPTNSSSTVGSSTSPVYLSSGTITACAYDLSANVNSGTSGRLAYYSSSTTIDDYSSTIGSSTRLWYLSSGTPTNSSSTIGSHYVPVWLSSGTIVASTQEYMVDRGLLKDNSSNWNNVLTSGMYSLSEWGTNGPTNAGYQFGTVAIFKSGTSSYGGAVSQLYMPHSDNGAGIFAAWRTTYQVSGSRWTNWHYLLDTGNYANFLNNYYVKKSGDNMTGDLYTSASFTAAKGLYLSSSHGRFIWDSGTSAAWLQASSSGSMYLSGLNATQLSKLEIKASRINLVSGVLYIENRGFSNCLSLQRTDSNHSSTIHFQGSSSDLGHLGLCGSGSNTGSGPAWWSSSQTEYAIANEAKHRFFYDKYIELGSYSTSNFYPYVFTADDGYKTDIEVAISSQSSSGSAQYNANHLHFIIRSGGLSDNGFYLFIINHHTYSSGEICIGSIGTGNQNGGFAVWLRGGLQYRVRATGRLTQSAIHTSSCSFGGSTYTVGSNTYGGSNSNVSIRWSPTGLNNIGQMFVIGQSMFTSSVYPLASNSYDCGGASNRWRTVYGVNGNFSGEVTAYTTSDIRLKHNITHLAALDVVRRMNVVEYNWNETALQLKADKTVHGYGLIAQELELLVPEAVSHSMFNADYLGIDYTKLVPFALSAILEVDDEVTKLKKRVKRLELRLRKYEAVDGLIVA